MTTLRAKLLLAGGATLVTLAPAWWIYHTWRDSSRQGETVRVIDNTAEVMNALERRATERSPVDAAGEFPPPLLREPLDEQTAKIFFPFVGRGEFDPYLYYSHEANLDITQRFKEHAEGEYRIQTNSLGMREAAEVMTSQPTHRVLVTGDSHSDGVCSNDETFSSLIERALAAEAGAGETVEVLNNACFGYSIYQYLAVLEKYQYLDPDLFIVAVYGGNDFYSMMTLQRYFHRREPPHVSSPAIYLRIPRGEDERGVVAQEFGQAQYFLDNPDDVDVAIATSCSISQEIVRFCREHDIAVLFVYIPPPYRGQPELDVSERDAFLARAGFDADALRASDVIADGWLQFLTERDVPHIDLRPITRSHPERLYYYDDHHINVAAHRVIADAILPQVRQLLQGR